VLGSGVLGVTAAYVLAARGHTVEVLERGPVSGGECSFANGGQLSYNSAEPWATPGVLKKLPRWLFHSDSPLIVRPRLDVDMLRWGLKFLRNCTPARAEANTMTLLRLGLYSRLKMAEIMTQTAIVFDYAPLGTLHVFGDEKSLRHAQKQFEFQQTFGGTHRVLTHHEVLELEPTLADTPRTIAGGIHALSDAQGDAYNYCVNLAEYCAAKLGVQFHYNTAINALETDGNRITAALTSKGAFHADAYVMALGAYSTPMLRPLGIHLPIYPMKGYSVTLPFNANSPAITVMDTDHKIVATKLGNHLRIAGTAEFAGYNHTIVPGRVKPIIAAAESLFPRAAWSAEKTDWACLRPSTPDGPPILGHTSLQNLFLNTGHGTLGWTQAAGSAYLVADIIEQRAPEIITQGLTLERI